MLLAEPSLSPSSLKVTEIAAQTAVVSWVPASSNLEHAVAVDGDTPTIVRRTCFVCHIAGLTPQRILFGLAVLCFYSKTCFFFVLVLPNLNRSG